ncbi:MAG: hypothetical protein LQ352_004631 [Teloschistes flavicans]|nr:MAG: hypothetical protein LQ352_004631 [Teloschistes flavicans]
MATACTGSHTALYLDLTNFITIGPIPELGYAARPGGASKHAADPRPTPSQRVPPPGLVPPTVPDDTSSQGSSRTMTKAEYTAEIKKAKAQFDALKVQHNAVEAERTELLQGHNVHREKCTSLSVELNRLSDEMREAKKYYGELKEELKTTYAELSNAQKELDKARTTIHVQSQTIQGRSVIDTTPRRPASTAPTALNASTAGSSFGHNYGFGIKPAAPSIQTDPRTSLYSRTTHALPPRLPAILPPRLPATSGRLPAASTALTIRGPADGPNVSWSGEFSLLYTRVEKFCRDYLNMPDNSTDGYWPTTLGEQIAIESSHFHVRNLAANPQTRYLFLTRIILGSIESQFFRARMIKGFSPEFDYKLSEVFSQQKSNNPLHVVRRLAQRKADLMIELSGKPSFDEWRTHYIRSRVNDLMAQLRPVIVPGIQPTLLGNTFASILGDAWRIGMKILQSISTFHIDWPAIGNHFEKSNMLNRDPFVTGNPEQLEARGALVALAITPRMVVEEFGTDVTSQSTTTKLVHMSNVLLRV